MSWLREQYHQYTVDIDGYYAEKRADAALFVDRKIALGKLDARDRTWKEIEYVAFSTAFDPEKPRFISGYLVGPIIFNLTQFLDTHLRAPKKEISRRK